MAKPLPLAPGSSATPMEGASPAVVIQPMVAPAPAPGDALVRGGTTAGRPGQIVSAANRWRENYNPLRNLTMRRVVDLLELGQRGDYAYLQWAYRFIERRNPTLSGLISRCEAPLAGFDWQIKTRSVVPQDADLARLKLKPGVENRRGTIRNSEVTGIAPQALADMAAAQKQTLDDAYNNIDNLRAALKHLHLADFREYAHLQKHRDAAGRVYHLEPLNQWCVCRDGLEGNWFWNPDSRSTSAPMQFLGPDFCIGGVNLPLTDFIIRVCPRPINEVGLVDTVRRGLCEKDWDGFIEIYGIPGGVVEMPANVPPGKEGEYETAARLVAEGGSGAIPNGSKYYANDGPRAVDPFSPRLSHLDEQLVLAGTGGKLAMLTEKAGGARGNSNVHDHAFDSISNGRAHACAEEFNRQFDAEILDAAHPGEPHLVYFDFGAAEEDDISALCTNVATLKTAGKNTNTQWLAEKTGYELEDAPPPPPALLPGAVPAPPVPGAPVPDPENSQANPQDDPESVTNRAVNPLDAALLAALMAITPKNK